MEIDIQEIRAADKDKPLEKQRIIEGEARKQLVDNGRLVRGVTEIFDVRTPVQRGAKGAFAWNPSDLRISLEDLKSRYDAPVWSAFEGWAKKEILPGLDSTVWEWLSGGQLQATTIYTHETTSLPVRPDHENQDPALARRIGRFGQKVFRDLYGGLHPQIDAPPPEAVNGAEIAAAVAGTKPLFHEQLGGNLSLIAAVLQAHLPPGVVASRIPGSLDEADHLVVYRPEAIARVFDSDPAFYRPNGEDDAAALRIAVQSHSIGELLGYGQRGLFEPGAVGVNFFTGDTIFAGFRTRPELAKKLAAARLAEYQGFLNKEIEVEIK